MFSKFILFTVIQQHHQGKLETVTSSILTINKNKTL